MLEQKITEQLAQVAALFDSEEMDGGMAGHTLKVPDLHGSSSTASGLGVEGEVAAQRSSMQAIADKASAKVHASLMNIEIDTSTTNVRVPIRAETPSTGRRGTLQGKHQWLSHRAAYTS